MMYGCPFEKITFLHKIDTNSGFGRDWDTLWTKSNNDIFITIQIKVIGHKIFQIPCTGSKVPNWHFLKWHFWYRAWNLKFLWPNIFIRSVMNMSLLDFVHNVSQSLTNPRFVSISQKDIHTAFPFLFPSVLPSC